MRDVPVCIENKAVGTRIQAKAKLLAVNTYRHKYLTFSIFNRNGIDEIAFLNRKQIQFFSSAKSR